MKDTCRGKEGDPGEEELQAYCNDVSSERELSRSSLGLETGSGQKIGGARWGTAGWLSGSLTPQDQQERRRNSYLPEKK